MHLVNTNCHRLAIVIVTIFGLIMAPIAPHIVWAADQGATAAGAASDESKTGTSGGGAAGVGVSGSPGKASPSGKGALAPPPKKSPQSQPAPVKSAEQEKNPKAIGASAGKAGTTGTDTETAGVSMGWKITGAVLGVGLLVGLAGGGGGGGGSTPSHNTAP